MLNRSGMQYAAVAGLGMGLTMRNDTLISNILGMPCESSIIAIVLPIAILVLSSALKWLVDQKADIANFTRIMLELPGDIQMIGLSFVAAATIANARIAGVGLLWFVIITVLMVAVIFLMRESLRCFPSSKYVKMCVLATVEYTISLFCLVNSIALVKYPGN